MGIKKSKKDVRAKRQRKREKEKEIIKQIREQEISEEKEIREKLKDNKMRWHKYPEEKPDFNKVILYSNLFDSSAIYMGECRNFNGEHYIVNECHWLNHYTPENEENEIFSLIEYPYWIYIWELGYTLFDQCGIVDEKTWNAFEKKKDQERLEYAKDMDTIYWSDIPQDGKDFWSKLPKGFEIK